MMKGTAMTDKLRAAAKQAIYLIEAWDAGAEKAAYWRDIEETLAALRAALAEPEIDLFRLGYAKGKDDAERRAKARAEQPAEQEPLAWLIEYSDTGEREVRFVAGARGDKQTPLYAAPQPAVVQVPPGFKLVPVEPTEEMLVAAEMDGTYYGRVAAIFYRAMIAKAPEAPQPAAEPVAKVGSHWSDGKGFDLHSFNGSPPPCGRPLYTHPAADEEILKQRDDAEDFIDAVLDEVLGVGRPEWSNAYGRPEALADVQDRMAALQAQDQPTPEDARDAARYRWIAENAVIYAADFKHEGKDPCSTKQPLDNAIDAAIRARQQGGAA
jgi:hypothetical protein